MEISKEQVLEIVMWGNSNDRLKVKRWFPEAFKAELEVGKVYKWKQGKAMFKISSITSEYAIGYGFLYDGKYCSNISINITQHEITTEATTAEWESALIEEAKKRGYKNGNYKCLYLPGCTEKVSNDFFIENKELWIGDLNTGNMIFKDGVWADIIKTFSKEEAEELLGGKII